MYRLALSRKATATEVQLGLTFLAEEAAKEADGSADQSSDQPAADAPLSAWERYVQVILLSNEFMYVD